MTIGKGTRSTQKLDRTIFSTSRAAEYFRVKELEKMTGQPREKFAAVVIKELKDNALDACEAAGVAPEVGIETSVVGAYIIITIADSGPGIAPEIVRRILDYDTRTSDKAAYRSPTRGTQGNALKTVIGIPRALGSKAPIIIESCGFRHEIKPRVLSGGDVRIEHEQETTSHRPGTRVTVVLPAYGQDLDAGFWAAAFSIVNPHLSLRLGLANERVVWDFDEIRQIYRSTTDFQKFIPTDPIPAHWYDAEALAQLIGAHNLHARNGSKDLPLGEFIRDNFRGLASTKKAKDVARCLPGIRHLSDFEEQPSEVPVLLDAMQRLSTPPSHNILGAVGKDHFRERFEEWYGLSRFWYKHLKGEMYGLPYRFEVAVAETDLPGALFTAINFSPTFDDPFAKVAFSVDELPRFGLKDYLYKAHALPASANEDGPGGVAVAVHLVTPAPRYLDLGKSSLQLPTLVRDAIQTALWACVKNLYKEGERRRKSAARSRRQEEKEARANDMSIRDAVFKVMPAAVEHTSGGGRLPVGVRRLFYAVRDRISDHTSKRLDSENSYKYFSQTLVPDYQREHGVIEGLYYDPQGRLHEPHTGNRVDLGTREVEAYEFPNYVYDKILFVEKKGQYPLLAEAKIADRYDMAIITGEGFASTAARELLRSARKDQDYQIFVLHDADPAGYNIARTVRKETRRMPGYNIEVIDLGLTVEQALEIELEPEEFVRHNRLPKGLLEELEEGSDAHEFFTGEEMKIRKEDGKLKTVWRCKRFELDKMTAPQAIEHLESALARAGVRPKLIPPDDALPELAEDIYREEHARWVVNALHELVSLPEIQQMLADKYKDQFELENSKQRIKEEFEEDDSLSWRAALRRSLEASQEQHAEELKPLVREKVIEALVGGEVNR